MDGCSVFCRVTARTCMYHVISVLTVFFLFWTDGSGKDDSGNWTHCSLVDARRLRAISSRRATGNPS